MPVSKLDTITALVVIDRQNSILGSPSEQPISEVVKHASALANAFRHQRLRLVLVNVTGATSGRAEQPRRSGALAAGWTELVPELNRQTEDYVVTKQTWGAYTNTGLDDHLKKLSVTQVVIAGVSTGIGVESTARQAHALGFNVTLAIDAMTGTNPDAHSNSITRIFPRLGETGTTQEIIELLSSGRT